MYTKITNTLSTIMVFGLCTCKWGTLASVKDHGTVSLTQISCNMVFSKFQNARKVGTLCIQAWCLKLQAMLYYYKQWILLTLFQLGRNIKCPYTSLS